MISFLTDSDCDHVMFEIAGTFESPGLYGYNEYGSNVLCMWMIERFTPDHLLQLLVVEMDIQPSRNCETEYLMVCRTFCLSLPLCLSLCMCG